MCFLLLMLVVTAVMSATGSVGATVAWTAVGSAPPAAAAARRRGLRWAVSYAHPGIDDFLLHDNNASWANTSLSVTAATVGIDQCCMPSSAALVINRSGHLVEAYPCTLNASRFAKYRAAGMFATVDIGAATDSHEASCPDGRGPDCHVRAQLLKPAARRPARLRHAG